MSLWGKKEMVCASCIHWSGERVMDSIFIETKKHEGKCLCENGFYELKTIQGSSCLNWKSFSES